MAPCRAYAGGGRAIPRATQGGAVRILSRLRPRARTRRPRTASGERLLCPKCASPPLAATELGAPGKTQSARVARGGPRAAPHRHVGTAIGPGHRRGCHSPPHRHAPALWHGGGEVLLLAGLDWERRPLCPIRPPRRGSWALPPGGAAGPHATPRRLPPRRPRREPPARPPYQQRHGVPAAPAHCSKHDARRDWASPPGASAGPRTGTAACVRLRAGSARHVAASPGVLAPLSPPSPSGPNLQEQASPLNPRALKGVHVGGARRGVRRDLRRA